MVEKHFCLSRDDPGLDDPIAMPPAEFSTLARSLRDLCPQGTGRII
jgi:sialic acid synthase SpsE